ncbi:unnamed protein product [Malus baccata var. baccata]
MASSAMEGRVWTRKEDEALCRAYRWVSEGSVRGSVWTRVSKKYYEFYEGTTPPNIRNHESCSSRWKKHLHPSLNKWHLEHYLNLHASLTKLQRTSFNKRKNSKNLVKKALVRQAEELYMEGSSKPFKHCGCWEICKGWVLFEDPPQH